MKLEKVDKVPKSHKEINVEFMETVDEFIKCGYDCARINDHGYKNPRSAVNAMNRAIKKHAITGVHVYLRNDELFLVRTDG